MELLQFKVVDFSGRYIQFISQERQKSRMVIVLDARGNRCPLVCVVPVELVRDLTENRNKLRLLIELEVVVNVPVDLNMCETWHKEWYSYWITHDGSPR
jgi:TusA-related sulfurtransferase